ncbi:MAG: glycosyltransferase family 25 protein [Fuerstiella sp.]|nr:glycosyltransferase family 25 protein [Fuerstiella sp.]
MAYCAFIISLERSAERFAHAGELLSQLPLPAEILPAVDGSLLSDADIASAYQHNRHRPLYPFSLNAGEIGCFLSHRNAWTQIVERNLDAALVLEDDVCIDQTLIHNAIECVKHKSSPGDFFQFPVRPLPRRSSRSSVDDNITIVCPQVTPLRTSGQWVTRDAAARLLDLTQVFDRPVDTFLQMHWITGVRLRAIEPSGISDMTADLGGSTIGAGKIRRLELRKLSREVNRAWYRWRIARRSAGEHRFGVDHEK